MIEGKKSFIGMLMTLHDQGVAELYIEYDGQGDEGEIHSVEYWDHEGNHIETSRESDTDDIIKDFCYGKLMDQVGDWYNNSGGFGTIRIKIPSGEYEIHSHIRVEETIDDNYSGQIQDFIKED